MAVETGIPGKIDDIQNEIIDEFSVLSGDKESTINYIMELGQRLKPLDEKYKVDGNIIKGCQSKVWLTSQLEGDRIIYNADSNTAITKGLISLLIRILSGQKVDDIIGSALFFIEKIGMGNIVGSQRSNGLASMIKQMKLDAIAYKVKSSTSA
jgi:cysteine desulfuration protein SufE